MNKSIASFTIIFVFLISLMSLTFYSGTASGNQLSPEYVYEQERNIDISDIFSEEEIKNANRKIYNFPQSSFLNFKKKKPFQKENSKVCDLPSNLKTAVLDLESGEIIYGQKSKEKNSIASITKLATALVFLDNNPKWDDYYKIKQEDIVGGARAHIYLGEKIKIRDLFFLSLIASDNTAAQSLANLTGIENFPEAMNKKMIDLGFVDTSFVDPVGLGMNNISTAEEVAKLLKEALKQKEIKTAIFKKDYKFQTLKGREVQIYSTDWLFRMNDKNFIHLGGKTGYTNSAGYCFTGVFKNDQGNKVLTVVLNGSTINSRFKYSKNLVLWIFNNFVWT